MVARSSCRASPKLGPPTFFRAQKWPKMGPKWAPPRGLAQEGPTSKDGKILENFVKKKFFGEKIFRSKMSLYHHITMFYDNLGCFSHVNEYFSIEKFSGHPLSPGV